MNQVHFTNSGIENLVRTMLKSYIDMDSSGADADPGHRIHAISIYGLGLEIKSQSLFHILC